MQTELPQDFVRLMHEHYDEATADALCRALDATEPDVSIRLNPRKLSAEEVLACRPDLEPVPWCPGAFFLPFRPAFTFDPLLHAGAYYVQEAASMYIAQVIAKSEELRVKNKSNNPADKSNSDSSSQSSGAGGTLFTLNSSLLTLHSSLVALDLCAAPGGKSTLVQSLLPEGSLLISNEPVPKRAQVLRENMQKWMMGQPQEAPRCIVTQKYPHEFGLLSGCVDLLLTDVPCSGEGMFRKDDVARQEWSLENVAKCQQRQRNILSDIWHVLKPGGLLIYSTCTFNRYEDEDNVRWICQEFGGELLMERHFLPGRDRGEGFYVAAIKAPGRNEEQGARNEEQGARSMEQGARSEGQEARSKGRGAGSKRSVDYLLKSLAPCSLPLAPLPSAEEAPRIELSYDEALQYLRREALRVEAPRGPVTLCYRGLVLGPGKGVGNRINNLYPEAWRIRTTYTTPFSLLGTD